MRKREKGNEIFAIFSIFVFKITIKSPTLKKMRNQRCKNNLLQDCIVYHVTSCKALFKPRNYVTGGTKLRVSLVWKQCFLQSIVKYITAVWICEKFLCVTAALSFIVLSIFICSLYFKSERRGGDIFPRPRHR